MEAVPLAFDTETATVTRVEGTILFDVDPSAGAPCSVSCGSGSDCSIQCAGESRRTFDGSANCG